MNCPIIERTGDGIPCGRCWYYLPDGKTCPRHGNVEVPVKHYQETGKLTLEQESEPNKKEKANGKVNREAQQGGEHQVGEVEHVPAVCRIYGWWRDGRKLLQRVCG